MTRWLSLGTLAALLVTAMIVAHRQRATAVVGPHAMLTAVAEVERDATRVPARLTRLSDAEEIAAGDAIASRLPQTASGAQRYFSEGCLQKVGNKVAAGAHRRLPYRMHFVADETMVNAFALPGGHVVAGQGLLGLMDSEDELAAVLGHEIAHVDDRHAAERLQTARTLDGIPVAGALAAIPVAFVQAGYAKEQELQADEDGLAMAVAAGYSPTGALRMFDKLAKLEPSPQPQRAATPVDEAGGAAAGLLTGYFRTHPYPSERRAAIQALIARRGWQSKDERPLEECRPE